tara:strand:- start:1089 stop:1997 length:909 start_codon:yes stop_codon:yes gene_type:complete
MADTWSTNLTTKTPIETSGASGLGDRIGGFLSSINPFGAIASGIGSIFGGGNTAAGEGMNTNTQNTGIETAASAVQDIGNLVSGIGNIFGSTAQAAEYLPVPQGGSPTVIPGNPVFSPGPDLGTFGLGSVLGNLTGMLGVDLAMQNLVETEDKVTNQMPIIGETLMPNQNMGGVITMPSLQGRPMGSPRAAFMSPLLGQINYTSTGKLSITRKLRQKAKSLADMVGLANAAQLAGIPIMLYSEILLKTFRARTRSVTTKEMRKCAKTYDDIKHFYNMIPSKTSSRRRTTRRSSGSGIQMIKQ